MTVAPPASLPKPSKQSLPPCPPGYHWRRHGVGFELRETVIENSKRRHIYRGHLSQSIHQRMKESGQYNIELERWISQRIGKKAA